MGNIRVFARQALGDRNVLDILALIDAAIDGSVGENHIANKNNPHEVTKAQVGLGRVDDTSDIDKPLSTLMIQALSLKAALEHSHAAGDLPSATTSAAGIVRLVNALNSTATNQALTAAQGKVLKDAIDNINAILSSDDTTLDEMQEIVDYIKQNRQILDALSISNIAGLQVALNDCVKLNDVRLTNSREWSADTMSQAEAEAGTATARRAVTSQRIRQNVVAYTQPFTSAEKTKLNDIQAGAQVNVATNLGLTAGTTAGPVITSSTGNNVTLPIATTSNSGVVTTGNQSFAGNKSFTGTVNAATFNATSTTGGGFQGIDNDTVAVPSFTWSGDLTTGMYRTGAGSIGFACAGTQRAFINSNGVGGAGSQLTALNASNLGSGTVPNARLSGTYDGVTVKVNGSNTVYTTPSSGTQNASGRTVYGLAEYRNALSNATGAIAFIAPTNAATVMMQFEIAVMLHSAPQIAHITVQAYRSNATTFNQLRRISKGTIDIQVRFAYDSAGRTCIILGDTNTVWSYPHVSIIRAMFSHNGTTDAYCTGWTTALLTSLTGYSLTANLPDTPMVGSITGSAGSVSQLLTPGTGISGSTYNGSNARTWSVAYGTTAGTACQGNDSRLITNLGITGTGDTRTITSSTGANVTIPVATASLAGIMSRAMVNTLNAAALQTGDYASLRARATTKDDVGLSIVENRRFNWSFGTGNPTHFWGSGGSAAEQYVYTPAVVASTISSQLGLGSNATRNLTISNNNPSGGANGDIWYKW